MILKNIEKFEHLNNVYGIEKQNISPLRLADNKREKSIYYMCKIREMTI